MQKTQLQGLPIWRFDSLAGEDGLAHGVTTRQGGVSVAPFDSLNLGLGEDEPQAVAANLERLRAALGLERLVFASQVHGERILAVNGDEASPIAEADGLATDRPGVGLLIKTADCQAVVLYDQVRRVVANLHVGWRGNVADVPGAGVRFLAERYGSDPADLVAAVSPSLGPCCAEFVNHADELGPEYLAYQVRPQHFDLWQRTVDQLNAAGVPLPAIEVAGVCTRCDRRFFSYRREGLTGRAGTVVALT